MASGGLIAQLLDVHTPLTERQSIFATFEKRAQDGSTSAQYVVGSLYRIGQLLPASPVPRDLDKARLYLSNAATHGRILAMAKMAEVELAAGNTLQAMVWAQTYGHYELLLQASTRPSEGYLAELLQRATEKFDKTKMPEVVNDLNAFVDNYDASVRTGVNETQDDYNKSDAKVTSSENMHIFYSSPPVISIHSGSQRLASGFADVLIAFKPDGSVDNSWLLDATPDAGLGKALLPLSTQASVTPQHDNAKPGLRYAWMPFVFDDERYTISGKR